MLKSEHTKDCALAKFAHGLKEYDPCKGYLVYGEWVDDEPDCDCGAYDDE